MDPNFWGPHLWIFLHTVAMNYPSTPNKEDIRNTHNFLVSLSHIIPCSVCRDHFLVILKNGVSSDGGSAVISPLTSNVLNNRDSFFKWIYDIHDYINKHKFVPRGKLRTESPPYESVVHFYNSKRIS